MSLAGKEIVLGISGSIAAYKAVLLLRELTARGAEVSVVMTAGAEHFVGPLTFRTLSGRAVLSNIFDPQSDEAVEHVALAERAHAFVVAPATANVLAKAAHGIADDFLTTLLLAARCPVLMAPAMDGGMWEHAAVQANVATLRERGVTVLEPDTRCKLVVNPGPANYDLANGKATALSPDVIAQLDAALTRARWALDAETPFETVRTLDPAPSLSILDEGERNLVRSFPAFGRMQVAERWAGVVQRHPVLATVLSATEVH